MRFSEGAQVLAKMPSSGDFEKAKVVTVKGNKYTIQFKGGVKHSMSEGDLKAPRSSRSQSRSRGRPPGKSPARSPARKSPARKSPARSPTKSQSRKLPVRSARTAKVTLKRVEIPKDTESSDTEESEEPPAKPRTKDMGRTRRSIRIASSATKAEQEKKLMALRSASLPTERKGYGEGKGRGSSATRDEKIAKRMSYDTDTDTELEEGKSKKKRGDLSKPQEFGGWFGALVLMLVAPFGMVLLQQACNNDVCSFKQFRIPRLKEIKYWRTCLNLEAMLTYGILLTFVSLMSLIPVGKIVDGQPSRTGRLKYRINGFLTLILSMVIFSVLTYQGYPVGEYLLTKSVPLATSGIVYGTLLALVLYYKGKRCSVAGLNIYGSTNSRIYNFFQGREINPRFGKWDIKTTLIRFTAMTTVLINLAAIFKIFRESSSFDLNNLNLAAITVASLQIACMSHLVLFEASWLTSFEYMYEGTGFMLCVGYLLHPFFSALTTKYLMLNKVNLPIYILIIFVLIFIGAFVCRIKMELQKDEFRKNPFATSLSHLETIPTKRGKRLIVSGYWGYVRHPNYVCEIVMHLCFSVLSYSLDILPHIYVIMTILLLVHRAIRDNARCLKRYGYAWEQYCSRVKYMLIKGVF